MMKSVHWSPCHQLFLILVLINIGNYSAVIVSAQITALTTSSTTNPPTKKTSVDIKGLKPLIILPLNNITFGSTKSGIPPLFPEHSQCFRLADDNSSLTFDGSRDSYIEHEITASVFKDQFVVFMKLYPAPLTTGTVFHFLSDDPSLGVIEVDLSINVTNLTLRIVNSTAVCGITVVNAVTPNTWNFIQITSAIYYAIVRVNDKLVGMINDPYSLTDVKATLLGRLRIGANHGGSGYFRGNISCVEVFQGISAAKSDKLLKLCQQDVSSPKGTGRSYCNRLPEKRDKSFTRKAASKVSAVVLPILKVKVKMKIQCLRLCVETLHCRSFSITTHAQFIVCSLYDFEIGPSGLINDPISKYFTSN